MELSQSCVRCDGTYESNCHLATRKQKLCTSTVSLEDSTAKNTFYSSCNQQSKESPKFLDKGKSESASSWDQLSTVKSRVSCCSDVKSSLPSGNLQMSSFERACYEDFQTYIPEISAETQLTFPTKLCEESPACGIVSSTPSVVNQNCGLTHYPNSNTCKVPPNARHYFYNENEEPFPCKDSKDKTSKMFGNCKYTDPAQNACMVNALLWPQEKHPDFHFPNGASSRSLNSTSQEAPPNKVVNHCGQQPCPTLSIRVDISCPLSSYGCNKICGRDNCSNSSMQHSYGNIPGHSFQGKRKNGILRSSFHHNLPGSLGTNTNLSNAKYNNATSYYNSDNADLSKSQFKSDYYDDTSVKLYPPTYEDVVNNNGFPAREKINDHMFCMNAPVQNRKGVTGSQRLSHVVGTNASDGKFPILKARRETLNSSTVKYQDKLWLGKNVPEVLSSFEHSCTGAKNGSIPLDGIPTNAKDFHLDNKLTNSNQKIVEFWPVDLGKSFGQHKFQSSGNVSHGGAQERLSVQAANLTGMRSNSGLNNSLLMKEPSSPIADLSNLVAKIHPDYGSIMTGWKNVKVEGNNTLLERVGSSYFPSMSLGCLFIG